MRRELIAVLAAVALVGACAESTSLNELRVSGHIEATEIRIAAQVGGRLLDLAVAEGDDIAAGDVIGQLDTADVELEIERARAERATIAAQLRLLKAGARPEDVRQAQAHVAALEAEIAAIEAERVAADADFERFGLLFTVNAGSRKQRDDAAARVNVLQERIRAVGEQVRAAGEVVARLEAGARVEEVETVRAQVASIDAQIAILNKRHADAVVVSPAAGIVTQVLVEQGEFVAPMVPLLVITDIDRAWANLFVPEPAVPRLAIGQDALVFTDAGGDGLRGTVTFVSRQAEFTPRNVQTVDERSRLVYRIKVSVDNREGVLKPGMPVDASLTLP
jgi:HlyD family secretion protein